MASYLPSIACLGVIGRNNNPLHISIFPSYDSTTNSFAPIRTPLQFSLILSSTIDIFQLRSSQNLAAGVGLSGDLGLLQAIDDRLAAYGFETNTGVRLVCIVDTRGRRPGTESASASAAVGTAAAAAAAGGSAGSVVGQRLGLRDQEIRAVFRAMQGAYVRLLQNPFYDPDEHSPLGGKGGKKIMSRRFAEDMKRIGEIWAPGVTSI